ncbi:hypothetical protein [Parafrankia sp. CH37]|uniref:hypothetical protein n=1 Tax=Parafrankia sp. CH37 TaxID=683308 RepID=UPI001868FB28|nr:hypothetical protein [Parafrankia sp. CH37]MBE3205152.1 hypothetical protein [Parafrankia sp. CH37]
MPLIGGAPARNRQRLPAPRQRRRPRRLPAEAHRRGLVLLGEGLDLLGEGLDLLGEGLDLLDTVFSDIAEESEPS